MLLKNSDPSQNCVGKNYLHLNSEKTKQKNEMLKMDQTFKNVIDYYKRKNTLQTILLEPKDS